MKGDLLHGNILAARIIPSVDKKFAESLKLREDQKSLLIFSGDADDIAYIAADYATKMCNVEVVYGESMWAGAANANTAFAGDVIMMLAGPQPEDVRRAFKHINEIHKGDEVTFVSANQDDSTMFLSYCISRTGSYLSELNGINKGDSLGYCVGAPMEHIYATDVAAKAANVSIVNYFAPPTATNFGGVMFTGSQSACKAACEAYAAAIMEVANNPIRI